MKHTFALLALAGASIRRGVKKVSAWEHGKDVPDEAETEKIRRLK